ncbi:hypothetical protein FACS1894184_20200 [Clostridia bacterium]|nr:hypothetical protein FACS1894184_20200 [Clostridia bacterium]
MKNLLPPNSDEAFSFEDEGTRIIELVDSRSINTDSTSNIDTTDLLEKQKSFGSHLFNHRMHNVHQTVFQLIYKDMIAQGWASGAPLRKYTGLTGSNYNSIKNQAALDNRTPANENQVNKGKESLDYKSILAIGVGLGVTLDRVREYLAAACMDFGTSDKDIAYKYLFTVLQGYSIAFCNMFLRNLGYEALSKA